MAFRIIELLNSTGIVRAPISITPCICLDTITIIPFVSLDTMTSYGNVDSKGSSSSVRHLYTSSNI